MAEVKKTVTLKDTVNKPAAETGRPEAAEVKKPAEVKTPEVKAPEVKKETPKKAASKRAASKKTTAKKTTVAKTEAKPAAVKAAKAEVKTDICIQYGGKSYTNEDLVKIAKDVWKFDLQKTEEELKDIKLFIKPEENTVYYVMNDIEGNFKI